MRNVRILKNIKKCVKVMETTFSFFKENYLAPSITDELLHTYQLPTDSYMSAA